MKGFRALSPVRRVLLLLTLALAIPAIAIDIVVLLGANSNLALSDQLNRIGLTLTILMLAALILALMPSRRSRRSD